MTAEVLHCRGDAVFVVVGGQYHCYGQSLKISTLISFDPSRAPAFAAEHEDEVDRAEKQAQAGRYSTVPDDRLRPLLRRRSKRNDQTHDREQNSGEVNGETEDED